jgi:WD40 repeat protein
MMRLCSGATVVMMMMMSSCPHSDDVLLQQRLRGHKGVVCDMTWNHKQALLASCSHDGTVRTWWWNQGQPVWRLRCRFVGACYWPWQRIKGLIDF